LRKGELNMVRKFVLALTGIGVAGVVAIYVLTIPLLRRLPKPGRVSMDGITTIDDAVEACRRTHLLGWDLVAYAQNLVARKFTYSRLNTWDTPSRAFERGMGYCEQQALALKKIYDRLGIEARPVFALRCKFPTKVVDGMPSPGGVSGHAWLRVRIGDEELDVCPHSVNNRPGEMDFEILSRVLTWQPWLRPWTHLGSSIENIRRDIVARRRPKNLRGAQSILGGEWRASIQPA
jgi:transglutaminase-like putative cysteine protease